MRSLGCVLLTLAVAGLAPYSSSAQEATSSSVQEAAPHPESALPADNLRLLTGRAGLIFKGVASGIEFETDPATGLPFTFVTFRQIEAIKDLSERYSSGQEDRLRLRLFGGLSEEGTMTEMTGVPDFALGGVYLIFYTAGAWDVSPIVGGENGVFRVVRSRTLGHEILLDSFGRLVLTASEDSFELLPVDPDPDLGLRREGGDRTDGPDARQAEAPIELDPASPYTEENVERMMEEEREERAESEAQPEDGAAARSRFLQELPASPISYDAFVALINEINEAYRNEFLPAYSEVRFEGLPVPREQNPARFDAE